MSTIPFGAPVQDEALQPDNHNTQPQNGAALSTPQADIDPNDPNLFSEVLTDDAKADAFALAPLIVDGKYRAKLVKHPDSPKDAKSQVVAMKVGISKRKGHEGQPYLFTAVQVEVLDASGKYDGYRLSDYFVDTQVGRSGTSAVATMTRACKVQTPAQGTIREYMGLLLGTLAKEPTVVVETQWEWECQTCQDAAKKAGERSPKGLRGMYKFPQVVGKPGVHDPQLKCDACGKYSVAQARVVGYFPA